MYSYWVLFYCVVWVVVESQMFFLEKRTTKNLLFFFLKRTLKGVEDEVLKGVEDRVLKDVEDGIINI